MAVADARVLPDVVGQVLLTALAGLAGVAPAGMLPRQRRLALGFREYRSSIGRVPGRSEWRLRRQVGNSRGRVAALTPNPFP